MYDTQLTFQVIALSIIISLLSCATVIIRASAVCFVIIAFVFIYLPLCKISITMDC